MESKNKIIAEFMGYRYETGVSLSGSWSRYFKNGGTFEDSFPEAKYDTSWDWLMPVVEKIQHTWQVDVCRVMDIEISSTGWNGYKTTVRISIMLLKSGNPYHTIKVTDNDRREATYTAVTEFIEWYNKEKDGK